MPSSNSPAAAWLKRHYDGKNAQTFIARAYRTAFGGQHGDAVLRDLQKACYTIDSTTGNRGGPIDPLQMAVNEGRRQAYLHIAGMLMVAGVELTTEGNDDYDHRDERRDGDGSGDEYKPRYPGGFDPELDGPIAGAEPAADAGSAE